MLTCIKHFFRNINSLINKNKDNELIFVIIIMSYFGDALVGNSLFQNIKRIYPNAKTVFIINKQYYEVAKYQKDVDEVVLYDKNGLHKGILGMLKFVKDFPYKNITYIFKMCKKSRVDILSFLLHPKKIINYDDKGSSSERYVNLLKKITNEKIVNVPIIYNADSNIPLKFKDLIVKNKKYVALCTVSSHPIKDMPISTSIDIIEKLCVAGYEVILVGMGETAKNYALELQYNNSKFINLVNSTSIYELAQVLRNCAGLISVDTGTMHLGYANNVPTVCCFYVQGNIKAWAPHQGIYPHTILPLELSSDGIYDAFRKLVKK